MKRYCLLSIEAAIFLFVNHNSVESRENVSLGIFDQVRFKPAYYLSSE